MNEIDWLAGNDPTAMLDHLAGKASDRKLRLLACAVARRYLGKFSYLGSVESAVQRWSRAPREAIETAERFAEDQASAEQLQEVRDRSQYEAYFASDFDRYAYLAAHATTLEEAAEAARTACENARQQAVHEAAMESPFGRNDSQAVREGTEEAGRAQGELIREVFGNPFRPVALARHWLHLDGGTVLHLAQLLYDEGRLAEAPYLADALTDVGCDNEALLAHLRSPGHARGCWAFDLLLGRE